MIIGSLLSYLGWFFFAAWSLLVGAVNIAVFGRELLPSESAADPSDAEYPTDTRASRESSAV